MRRKEDATRYGIKPKQQFIGISVKKLDEMQEVLLLHRKRQGKSTAGKKNVYRVAKQMEKSRQDVVGVNFVKDANGKVLVENDHVKKIWRKY